MAKDLSCFEAGLFPGTHKTGDYLHELRRKSHNKELVRRKIRRPCRGQQSPEFDERRAAGYLTAQAGRTRQAAQVAGQVVFDLEHRLALGQKAFDQGEVTEDDRHPGGQGLGPAGGLEDPGVAQSAPADHHRVAAGFGHHPQAVLVGEDVAVADHRHPDTLFDPRDYLPVGHAAEALRPGPAMHGQGGGAGILRHPGKIGGDDGVLLHAAAEFHAHRQGGVGADRADDGLGLCRYPSSGRPRPLFWSPCAPGSPC